MNQQKFTEGLVILTKLGGENVSADHEVVLAGGPEPSDMDEDTFNKLESLNWHWNDEFECWRFFT